MGVSFYMNPTTPTKYSDLQADQNGNLTADQVNAAFREVYGIDAPSKVVNDFAGHVGGRDTSFLQRVQRGDFTPEISQNNPDYLKQSAYAIANRQQQEAIRPAVESYQASIPEITQKFEQTRQQLGAELTPLKQRYQDLLDRIKGQQQTAENRQTRTTNNELARRGISSDSGVYQQEMTDVLNPITAQFANIAKDTAFQSEADIRGLLNLVANLGPQEVEARRAITQAIANLQANAGQQGIAFGRQDIAQAAQDKLAQQQLEFQRQQAQSEAAQREFENQLKSLTVNADVNKTNVDIQKILSDMAKKNSSSINSSDYSSYYNNNSGWS